MPLGGEIEPVGEARTHRRARSSTHWARQIHRWLGLFIGIQFILWTAGGLYFAWADLDEIHGDHLRSPQPQVTSTAGLVSPSVVVEAIRRSEPVDSLAGLALVELLGRPTYRVDYFSRVDGRAVRKRQLADATSGALRQDISEAEAVALARQAYTGNEPVRSAEYLTVANVGSHHEYRGGPLLFVTFGVGAGLASTFEPLRPLFTVLTLVGLGIGFYTVYGRPAKAEACAPGDACAGPRSRRRERILLWGATMLAALFWSFPSWSILLV
jgi:hypothetical protein